MPKIELPPEVKCWRCDSEGSIVGVKAVGKDEYVNYFYKCPDCSAGKRYVFDDLAAAVKEAGYTYKILSNREGEPSKAEICRPSPTDISALYYWELCTVAGPNPTTALLMAILKCNEVSDAD